MAIASGTWGTISWSISDAGKLTLGGGVQPWLITSYPWDEHKESIASVEVTGTISKSKTFSGGEENATYWGLAFDGCTNLTSVSGLSNIKNADDATGMFSGCSKLVTLDLSGFDTGSLTSASHMLFGCAHLTSVKFGSFGFGSLEKENQRSISLIDFVSNFRTASRGGIVVGSDEQFISLKAAEQAGTWTRHAEKSEVECTAYRSDGTSKVDDGTDVTFEFSWVFSGATSAGVKIYQKAASTPDYPSAPTATTSLSGASGNALYTLQNIGDGAYDYRVEIAAGSSTYVFFPVISSNVRLMDFDTDGNAHIYGNLTTDGDVTDGGGNVLSQKLDATSASTTYLSKTDASSTYLSKTDASTTYLPKADLLDLVYPVGAIYISTASTSPATLFGGTWQRITGRFLLAATDGGAAGGNSNASIAAGNTGGEATHKLTAGESGVPAHGHGNTFKIKTASPGNSGNYSTDQVEFGKPTGTTYNNGSMLSGGVSQNTAAAASSAHNNMPPYLAVYMWKRTA